MNLDALLNWLMGLSETYGVDPVIFGTIYVGAIPLFWVALLWLASSIRLKKSIVAPVILAGSCAVSSYVYLIFAGENVPVWVYGLIFIVIGYVLYATWKKVQQKKQEALEQEILGQEAEKTD